MIWVNSFLHQAGDTCKACQFLLRERPARAFEEGRGGQPEDQGPDKHLEPIAAGKHTVDEFWLRMVIEEAVGDDDGFGIPSRPPIRREVDHGRRLPTLQQHVSSKIPVHELARCVHGTLEVLQRRQQPVGVSHCHRTDLIPRDAVGHRPGMLASVKQVGPGQMTQCPVKGPAGGYQHRPLASRPLLAIYELKCRPPGHDVGAVVCTNGPGNSKLSRGSQACEQLCAPFGLFRVVHRLQDRVPDSEALSLTTRERVRRSRQAEGCEHACWGLGRRSQGHRGQSVGSLTRQAPVFRVRNVSHLVDQLGEVQISRGWWREGQATSR